MSTVGAISSGLQGIQAAEKMAENAAADLTRAGVDSETKIEQDIVTLSIAKEVQRVNIEAIKTARATEKKVVDILV